MSDGYDELDPGDGYGPSPATRVRTELYVRPALSAVAVEIVVVLFFGNQWMLDHVVVPWSDSSANIVQQSISDALSAVSWTLTPHGYAWLWLGSIVRALVWFALTYVFVRRLVDVRDVVGRFMGVIGAVFLAQLGAILVERLVDYPDVGHLYQAANELAPKPGLFEWLLSGAVGTGGVLAFTLIAAVVAAVFSTTVSASGTDDDAAVPADEPDYPDE